MPVGGGGVISPNGQDAAAPADAGGAQTIELGGNVVVLDSESFSEGSDYLDVGVVGAEGAAGRVTAEFTGPGYALEGALRDPAVWVDVEPTATTLALMPTLQRADTRDGVADLALVRRVTMENIAVGLLAPIVLDPDRGHAVLRFVDSTGRGLPGVVIDTHPGSVVAYDIGSGLFRDDQPETTEAGWVAILDAAALPFPGAVTRVGFVGARQGAVDVKFAADAVTMVVVGP